MGTSRAALRGYRIRTAHFTITIMVHTFLSNSIQIEMIP